MFTIPGIAAYIDLSLLLLRVVVAVAFGTSGFNHLKSPTERAASIGMTVPFTVFIGVAELAGAIGLVAGLLTQCKRVVFPSGIRAGLSLTMFSWMRLGERGAVFAEVGL